MLWRNSSSNQYMLIVELQNEPMTLENALLQAILEVISKYHTPTGLLDSVTAALIQRCTSSSFHINNKWIKWKQLLGTSEDDDLPCSNLIIPKHEITATGSWLLSCDNQQSVIKHWELCSQFNQVLTRILGITGELMTKAGIYTLLSSEATASLPWTISVDKGISWHSLIQTVMRLHSKLTELC